MVCGDDEDSVVVARPGEIEGTKRAMSDESDDDVQPLHFLLHEPWVTTLYVAIPVMKHFCSAITLGKAFFNLKVWNNQMDVVDEFPNIVS